MLLVFVEKSEIIKFRLNFYFKNLIFSHLISILLSYLSMVILVIIGNYGIKSKALYFMKYRSLLLDFFLN